MVSLSFKTVGKSFEGKYCCFLGLNEEIGVTKTTVDIIEICDVYFTF